MLGLSAGGLCAHLYVLAALRTHGVRTGRDDLATTAAALSLAAACALGPYWIAERFGVDDIAMLTIALGAALLPLPMIWYGATHGRKILSRG